MFDSCVIFYFRYAGPDDPELQNLKSMNQTDKSDAIKDHQSVTLNQLVI